MNFNVTLSDKLSQEIIKKSDKNNVTATQYIEILLNSIIIDDPLDFDYIGAAKIVIQQAENFAYTNPIGRTFALNELPYFKELKNTVALNGKTAPSTVKARIGKNFNKSVSSGKVKNVERARNGNNELLFWGGSAVYRVISDSIWT